MKTVPPPGSGGAEGPGVRCRRGRRPRSPCFKALEALGGSGSCFNLFGGSWRLWVMLQLVWRLFDMKRASRSLLRQVFFEALGGSWRLFEIRRFMVRKRHSSTCCFHVRGFFRGLAGLKRFKEGLNSWILWTLLHLFPAWLA